MDDLGAFYMNSDNAREYAIIPAAVQVILQLETFLVLMIILRWGFIAFKSSSASTIAPKC